MECVCRTHGLTSHHAVIFLRKGYNHKKRGRKTEKGKRKRIIKLWSWPRGIERLAVAAHTDPVRLTAHFNQFGQKSLTHTRACESQIPNNYGWQSTYFSAMSWRTNGTIQRAVDTATDQIWPLWGGFGQSFQLLFSNKLVYSLRRFNAMVGGGQRKKLQRLISSMLLCLCSLRFLSVSEDEKLCCTLTTLHV